MVHLLIAHPGHELLLYGWIARTKPVAASSPTARRTPPRRASAPLRRCCAASYAVVGHPHASKAEIVVLDDAEYAAKIERARRYAATLTDIEELLSRHGADAYRHEAFAASATGR